MHPIAQKIQEVFVAQNRTLALAESCTGGALGSTLVEVPDSSLYFLGSIVAYSTGVKRSVLKVPQELLTRHGAVSEPCAIEMAKGTLLQLKSDYALAITGIAGPSGGSLEKPVGTVCFSIQHKFGDELTWTSTFSGDRESIIHQTVEEALMQLYNYFMNSDTANSGQSQE